MIAANEHGTEADWIEADVPAAPRPLSGGRQQGNDAARAEAAHRAHLLQVMGLDDAATEAEFTDLVELAAIICGKPLGAMTLLNETHNYTHATHGMPAASLPLSDSFCRHTALQDDVMMVENTHDDTRFENNVATRGEGGIRFYAGTPLLAEDGTHVGALCVMDTAPATLAAEQVHALGVLGRQISNRLQLRERAAVAARLAVERERGQQMLETILNLLPVEVYTKDTAGRLLFYNQQLADRFGITRSDWLGKTNYDLWDRTTADNVRVDDEETLRLGVARESFLELPETADRTSYWRTTKVPCKDVEGSTILACCSIDVTGQMRHEAEMRQMQHDLEEANRKLQSLALTDALTGLWNRRAFDARLETSVIGSHRSGQPLSLLLLDLDNFKSINDRFGHLCGDTVLRHMGALLNRVKRAEDVACRFGGEEFAILLPGSDRAGAQALGERILEAMHAFPWEKEPVTASIGVSLCSSTCSGDDLVDRADAALYRAKHAGKNRVELGS